MFDNNWHQIVIVFNRAGNALIYRDSALQATTLDISSQQGYITNSQPTYIGGAGNSYVFNGLISNVQIYNTSLNAVEIQGIYAEGIGGAPTRLQNLVGWWPLNGNANDYSGNGNNGAATSVLYTSTWTK